jgi:hypothetical protein
VTHVASVMRYQEMSQVTRNTSPALLLMIKKLGTEIRIRHIPGDTW